MQVDLQARGQRRAERPLPLALIRHRKYGEKPESRAGRISRGRRQLLEDVRWHGETARQSRGGTVESKRGIGRTHARSGRSRQHGSQNDDQPPFAARPRDGERRGARDRARDGALIGPDEVAGKSDRSREGAHVGPARAGNGVRARGQGWASGRSDA